MALFVKSTGCGSASAPRACAWWTAAFDLASRAPASFSGGRATSRAPPFSTSTATSPPPPGERGRHPLPAGEDFEAAARRAGIGAGTSVVAYDEAGEGGAARLWWLLRHFGHDDVAVLDGGLRAWRENGGPLDDGEPDPPDPEPFSARPRSGDTATAEELARHEDGTLLLDARAPERYRGEVEPVDAVAGHIPGR